MVACRWSLRKTVTYFISCCMIDMNVYAGESKPLGYLLVQITNLFRGFLVGFTFDMEAITGFWTIPHEFKRFSMFFLRPLMSSLDLLQLIAISFWRTSLGVNDCRQPQSGRKGFVQSLAGAEDAAKGANQNTTFRFSHNPNKMCFNITRIVLWFYSCPTMSYRRRFIRFIILLRLLWVG